MTLAEPRTRRFTREEYRHMADSGFFAGQRVELIDGEIIEMPPQHESHARAVMAIIEVFSRQIKGPFKLRCQMPLAMGNSEPEPDIAIVTLPLPKEAAPHTAALVVEVADSSLAIDRHKSHLYASVQVPEYWIINLKDLRLERYLDPVADAAAPFSARYATTASLAFEESIQPVAVPVGSILISALAGVE